MSSSNPPQKPDEQKDDAADEAAPPPATSNDDPLSSYASNASLSHVDRALVRDMADMKRKLDALMAKYGAPIPAPIVGDDLNIDFAREAREFKKEMDLFAGRLRRARLQELPPAASSASMVAGTDDLSSAPLAAPPLSIAWYSSTVQPPQQLVESMMDSSPGIQESSLAPKISTTNQGQPQELVKMMQSSNLQEPSSVKEITPDKRAPEISANEDHHQPQEKKKKTEKDDKDTDNSSGLEKA